jgi:hypothetical protein
VWRPDVLHQAAKRAEDRRSDFLHEAAERTEVTESGARPTATKCFFWAQFGAICRNQPQPASRRFKVSRLKFKVLETSPEDDPPSQRLWRDKPAFAKAMARQGAGAPINAPLSASRLRRADRDLAFAETEHDVQQF